MIAAFTFPRPLTAVSLTDLTIGKAPLTDPTSSAKPGEMLPMD